MSTAIRIPTVPLFARERVLDVQWIKFFRDLTSSGGASGTPAAPVNAIQFNDGGSFGGSSSLTWDGTAVTIDTSGGGPGNIGLDISGLDARIAIAPLSGQFYFGFPASAATLRLFNAVGTETVNVASGALSYLLGGAVLSLACLSQLQPTASYALPALSSLVLAGSLTLGVGIIVTVGAGARLRIL